MSEKKKKNFKAEVRRMLDLMIHSLYSNKEIFLRELIANAADALDKARFESLTNPDIAAEGQIRIEADKKSKTLKISDNGIGMSEGEIIDNLGTIAKSGTRDFLNALEDKDIKESPELIGQFGVGFYSAFMVADKVEVVSRRAGAESAVRWESDGQNGYVIDEAARPGQGTDVILHLKESCQEFLEEWRIKSIVKNYSDFIEHPIVMSVTRKEKDESEKIEDETLNSRQAIWLRPASEISEDEYNRFYEHLSHFDKEPLLRVHYTAEGTSEFRALVYVPSKAPFDLFFPDGHKKSLQLYVRRVFICDDCPGLLPEYLRFVKGVVDSSDLPLNISRETLQDNPMIAKIGGNIVRKLLNELASTMRDQPEKYLGFYKEFGKVLKEGVHSDFENRERLRDLLMFETMKGEPGKLVSLKEYVSAMPASQKEIYYLTGENRGVLENSPHLELLRSRGCDVIFMVDPVDEWVAMAIPEYDGKKLRAVGKGEITLDEDDDKQAKEKVEKATGENKHLLEFLGKTLEDKIKEARFSRRLTESACCLVGDDYAPSAHMERMMRAMNQPAPTHKRSLELNPDHPLVEGMRKCLEKDAADPRLSAFAALLYDQALLTEGNPIPDPLQFSKRLSELMVASLDK